MPFLLNKTFKNAKWPQFRNQLLGISIIGHAQPSCQNNRKSMAFHYLKRIKNLTHVHIFLIARLYLGLVGIRSSSTFRGCRMLKPLKNQRVPWSESVRICNPKSNNELNPRNRDTYL